MIAVTAMLALIADGAGDAPLVAVHQARLPAAYFSFDNPPGLYT